jgi:folate-binding protein YgfZ
VDPTSLADTPSATGTPGQTTLASRWLVASRATARSAEPRGGEVNTSLDVGSPIPSLTRDEWRALDIASGIPQVYAATSEAFVAQMLNLDLVDGIAFDKGCYTGQEVIARAHYRGKVKRRMQRFRTRRPAKLGAGDAGTLNDGRSFKVVDAVQLNDGRCEFLAVTTFGEGGDDADASAVTSTAAASSGSVSSESTAAVNTAAVNAEQFPLPYSLPA